MHMHMARLCYEMASVMLVCCEYREGHAGNNNKNSSGDEIANVNFFYNIAHVEASAYAH